MKSNWIGRAALFTALLGSFMLSSCGGGQQVERFQATRIIAFGDENSVITNTGAKYTVNAIFEGTTATLDCLSNPIWIQTVAGAYGLTFPQCNPQVGTNPAFPMVTDPTSRIYATAGAKVADLQTQVDQQQADGGFTSGDMVTVLVGVNDIIAQFAQYPVLTQDELNANAASSGMQLALQVNRIASLGAKVIISTIPNVGLMPFAGDRTQGSTNPNPSVLSAMSKAFNDGLLKALLNDGHQIGLVQLDQYLITEDANTINNTNVVYVDTMDQSCVTSAPAPTCTTQTLVANAIGFSWLWADDRHLSATGQTNFGALAATRATNNPF